MSDDNLIEQAKKSANGFPDSWNPEPGDTLVGIVLDIRDAKTTHGTTQIAEVQKDNGEILTVWLNRSVLQRLWKKHKPQINDKVAIAYEGPENHPEGHKNAGELWFHKYGMAVQRKSPVTQTTLPTTETPEEQHEQPAYTQDPVYIAILSEIEKQNGQDVDVLCEELIRNGFTMKAIRAMLDTMRKHGIIAESGSNILLV